jgi:hypothetical protein
VPCFSRNPVLKLARGPKRRQLKKEEKQEEAINFVFYGILPICACVLSHYMETLLDCLNKCLGVKNACRQWL